MKKLSFIHSGPLLRITVNKSNTLTIASFPVVYKIDTVAMKAGYPSEVMYDADDSKGIYDHQQQALSLFI